MVMAGRVPSRRRCALYAPVACSPMGTAAADVLAILDLLARAGAPAVVAGGWGIDALIGRQTREHADLDVAIDGKREAEAMAALDEAGFSITTNWRPVRVVLTHPDGAEVDLHPLRYRPDGSAVQAGLDGVQYEYPTDGFTTGVICGREIACVAAEAQVRFHTGYPPSETDLADMAALAAATGVILPESFGAES